MIAEWAEPLPDVDDAAFGRMFDRFAGRVVLLGEASHCTAEFYRARAAITRRLIEQHGFTIVAVEADWPDAAAIDRYVRHRPAPAHGADEALRRRLVEPRPERFIGVIYRPETELMSHYADASLAKQFDAYVWFDETTAVTPLGPEHARSGVPDTYPFGL